MSETGIEHEGPLGLRAMKRNAARAALDFVEPGSVIGVGSGTTVWTFIDMLAESGMPLAGAVSTSNETTFRLRQIGIPVVALSEASPALYIDGADEIDMAGRALKGKGGALTREKVVATACAYWACIVDATKVKRMLVEESVSLEVAETMVDSVRESMAALGGVTERRAGQVTDAGNPLLDVAGLSLCDPAATEELLDDIPGIIGNGIFARRRADVILVGRAVGGVSRIVPNSLVDEFA
jgi:ribose 5-phosphate isomerase A